MAIIENCELWFAKLDPKKPNNKFNKKNPTWEIQIRTKDKEQKKLWDSMHLPVKAVLPDEGDPYWRVNLRKKSKKESGEDSSFVKVLNGDLDDVDPNSIGNGSIGNVRVYQYEHPKEGGGTGIANVLMGIQLTKHIVYEPKPRDDDFQTTKTETIHKEPEGDQEDDMGDEGDEGDFKKSTPSVPGTPKPTGF